MVVKSNLGDAEEENEDVDEIRLSIVVVDLQRQATPIPLCIANGVLNLTYESS